MYWSLGDAARPLYNFNVRLQRALKLQAIIGSTERLDGNDTHRICMACSLFVCLNASTSLPMAVVRHKQPRQIIIAVQTLIRMPCSSLPFFLFAHLSSTLLFLCFRAECSTTPLLGSLDLRPVNM